MTHLGPLAGVRVVDLSTTFMGPYCTLLMAQMGAEVIKVESPKGDVARYIQDDDHRGLGPTFLNVGRGKRSIAIDLRVAAGRELLLRLCQDADVFIHNLRPAAVRGLGIEYEAIRERAPTIIYCMMRGFGGDGPYRDKPAYDDVVQAVSGIAAVQAGDGGVPAYVRTAVADKTAGLIGLNSVLAALYHRQRTGEGQAIEVPMFEAMVAYTLVEQQGRWVYDPPRGDSGYPRTASRFRKPYETADGYIGVLVYTDAQWASFFNLIGQPSLADEPKYHTIGERTENIDELYQIVQATLRNKTTEEWLSILDESDIPAMPMLTIEQLFEDHHLKATQFFREVDHPTEGRLRQASFPVAFSQSPVGEATPAPRLGEDTLELLQELGYSPKETERLIADLVIGAC